MFLQCNEKKQIKKNTEYISTIIEALAICISGILNVIRRYLTEMLASTWNLKCHRIKLDVKWLDGTGGLIVIRGCNNTP